MIQEAFLLCALASPGVNYTRPPIVSHHLMSNELDDLNKMIDKLHPGAEVFITPKGQAGKLKEHGWERAPFTWKGEEIWIRRRPSSDKAKRSILESA